MPICLRCPADPHPLGTKICPIKTPPHTRVEGCTGYFLELTVIPRGFSLFTPTISGVFFAGARERLGGWHCL